MGSNLTWHGDDPTLPSLTVTGSLVAGDITTASFTLSDTVWDDLTFPSVGINPPGAASDPSRNTTTGLLEFSGTADNIIVGVAQTKHAWKRYSSLKVHCHLRFMNAASGVNTRWKFEYDVATVNGNFTNAYGTFTALTPVTCANPNNALKHVILSLGTIDMTDMKESAAIVWKFSRLAATDELDDDTGAVALLDLDFHFEIDKLGTPDELPA